MEKIIILAAIFFFISTLFSIIGMGGGILYLPILLFAGYTFEQAPAISLILIIATSIAALTNFSKSKKVDWKLALVIDPPTDIMAFVGGYFAFLVPEPILKSILVFILMIAGTLMLFNKKTTNPHIIRKEHWWLWHRDFHGEKYTVNLPLVLTATALIGILSGMLGITGGMIKLPIMVLLCGVPMDIAIATSTVMVSATAMFGLAGHTVNSQIDWKTGIILAITAILGGLLGSRISISLDKAKLKKWFGLIIWIISIKILTDIIK
jgi:uncharacterized membrane protein YfcA